MSPLPPLPADHVRTRDGLHAVVEQVLAAARFAAVGKIGLTVIDGSISAGPFPGPAGGRTLTLAGTTLVVQDAGAAAARTSLTTVAAAAAAAGVAPGANAGTYAQATPRDPDRALDLDPDAVAALLGWFDLGQRVLAAFAADAGPGDDVTPATLWSEHFDLAIAAGAGPARANYGASPGDAAVPQPYLYVGPWEAPAADAYWNATGFPGALLTYEQLAGSADPDADALAFLRAGRDLLTSRT